jgi:hypothetical protein
LKGTLKTNDMKRKESKEPDLFVVNRKLTDKERKEIVDFIEEYKRNKNLTTNKKRRKAA